LVASFDYEDFGGMDEKTAEIRNLISNAEIPEDLYSEIKSLAGEFEKPEPSFVAVRSSVVFCGRSFISGCKGQPHLLLSRYDGYIPLFKRGRRDRRTHTEMLGIPLDDQGCHEPLP
jgi:phosphoenolpyruvate synthase/pyruvate phosphate dikinase